MPSDAPPLLVPAWELRRYAGDYLDALAKGRDVIITRHGKRVGRMVPYRREARDAEADQVVVSKDGKRADIVQSDAA